MITKQDPAGFLLSSGVLFAINHQVLHPLGLALVVETPGEPTGDVFGRVQVLATDDPTGFFFEEEEMLEGLRKYLKYSNENESRLVTRAQRQGELIQLPTPAVAEVLQKEGLFGEPRTEEEAESPPPTSMSMV